ncbi:autotransporter-associated beta strand repeat-containing protein [Luteolibacter arcticus]|uniref:Autotransporter-associated beta strand repeat-containing protein n=1 Tax=Luteolibacter arcticus TaxID=1581411 RepID=A0ABT3GKB0_9BACT|nr:autotransporter-associated beta strand repeat-containing protein [Luteolibacter arcticus]MCW1923906.1 autotransporter-associated beta strand repeat-containing protein [Luteolibacter arcticus]
MKKTPRFIHLSLLFGSTSLHSNAASGTWTNPTAGGLWSATGNWSAAAIADGSGSTADFSTLDLTTDNIVHLNTARTIGNLNFGDTDTATAAGWLLDNNVSATNILTLVGGTPTITVGDLGTGKSANITAVLAGTSGLIKNGAGTLTLSGANTYAGGSTLSGGTLALSTTGTLGAVANTLSVSASNSATLDLLGTANRSLSTGLVTLNAGSTLVVKRSEFNVDTHVGSTTISGNVSGTGTVVLGPNGGAVALTPHRRTTIGTGGAGFNAFTGKIVVESGSNLALFAGSLLDPNNNDLEIKSGGVVSLLAGSSTFVRDLTGLGSFTKNAVASTSILTVESGSFGGIIAGNLFGGNSTTVDLTKTTAGTLTLSGVNAYSGATTITGGTLEINGAGQLQNGAYAGTISNAGTIRFNSTANQTLSGVLSGAGGFIKDNSGTVALSAANTNTGAFTVNGGNLVFAKQVSLYNNTPANWTAANLIVNSGGTLGVNVGGTGEFTAADLDSLKALGTGAGGFLSGSLLGINTTNAGGNFTYASNIGDSNGGANVLGLHKLGTGVLTLIGTNTYTGPTRISGGVALFPQKVSLYNNTPASWNATNLIVGSGGTLAVSVGGAGEFTSADLDALKALGNGSGGFLNDSALGIDTTNAGGTFTYASDIANTNGEADALGLTKLGTGTLVLTGALTYTGPTSVLGGSIEYASNSDQLISGVVSGASALTKSGSGKLTLTGVNAFTGNIDILGGTLEIGEAGRLGNGTFAGTIANEGVFLYNSSANQTLSGVISGSGSLIKDNFGTLTLSGLNTYSGTTRVRDGILSINSIKSVNGGPSAIGDVTTGSAGTIDLGSDDFTATLRYTGPGDTSDRVINLAGTTGGGTIDQSGSGVLTLTGALTATGADSKTLTLTGTGTGVLSGGIPDNAPGTNLTSVVKNGTGTWILGGSNTYGGTTTIGAGILQFQQLASVPANDYSRISIANGATLVVNAGGAGQFAQSNLDDLLLNNPAAFDIGALLGIDTTGGDFSFDPVNHFGDLGLAKFGANKLTLTTVAPHTGATLINGGTLAISADDTLPTAAVVALNSTGSGTTPAALDLGTFNQTIGGLTVSNSNSTNADTISIAGGKILAVNGPVTIGRNADASTTLATITGAGEFTVSNPGGTFQVGGASGGATVDNAAKLDMSGLSAFTANLGTGGTFRVGDVLGASEGTSAGASTVILAKTSTVTADTLDVGGTTSHASVQTLKLGDTTNTINANTVTIGSGPTNGQRASGAIQFNTDSGTLKIRTAADPIDGRATMNVVNTPQATGAILSGTVDLTGHSSNVRLGILTMAVRTGNSGASGCDATFSFDSGSLDVSSIVLATKTGTGTATSTGTLNIGGGTANIGGIAMANATGTHIADAEINLTGGTATLGGNITRTGTTANSFATINLDGGTLDMGGFAIGAANPVTFNAKDGTLRNLGQLNNGGIFTKSTSGTLILASASTYTGATSVTGGALLANNLSGSATGTNTITVKATATLGGTGAVSGAVVLESGGTIAPGTSGIESLATGALTLPSGAALGAQIDSSGTPSADVVNVTGNVTLGGTLAITDIAGVPATIASGTKLTLITYTGSLGGTFNGLAEGATFNTGLNTFKIRYADSGAVTLEANPGGGGYSTWAGTNAPSQAANQDFDNDGVPNAIEYVLGGLATTKDLGKLPKLTTPGGNLVFTFLRDQDSKTVDTSVFIDVGTTLAAWPSTYTVGNNTAGSTAGVTVTDNLNGTDTVTLTIPRAPDAKKFARLRVEISP